MSKECQVGPEGLELGPLNGGLGQQQQQQQEEVVVGEEHLQQHALQSMDLTRVARRAAAAGGGAGGGQGAPTAAAAAAAAKVAGEWREAFILGEVLVHARSSSRRGANNGGKGGKQMPSTTSSSRKGTQADQQTRGMTHKAGSKSKAATTAGGAAAAVAIVQVLPLPIGDVVPAAAAGVGGAKRLITQVEPVVVSEMAQYQVSQGVGGIGVVPLHLPLVMPTAAEEAKIEAAFGNAAAADYADDTGSSPHCHEGMDEGVKRDSGVKGEVCSDSNSSLACLQQEGEVQGAGTEQELHESLGDASPKKRGSTSIASSIRSIYAAAVAALLTVVKVVWAWVWWVVKAMVVVALPVGVRLLPVPLLRYLQAALAKALLKWSNFQERNPQQQQQQQGELKSFATAVGAIGGGLAGLGPIESTLSSNSSNSVARGMGADNLRHRSAGVHRKNNSAVMFKGLSGSEGSGYDQELVHEALRDVSGAAATAGGRGATPDLASPFKLPPVEGGYAEVGSVRSTSRSSAAAAAAAAQSGSPLPPHVASAIGLLPTSSALSNGAPSSWGLAVPDGEVSGLGNDSSWLSRGLTGSTGLPWWGSSQPSRVTGLSWGIGSPARGLSHSASEAALAGMELAPGSGPLCSVNSGSNSSSGGQRGGAVQRGVSQGRVLRVTVGGSAAAEPFGDLGAMESYRRATVDSAGVLPSIDVRAAAVAAGSSRTGSRTNTAAAAAGANRGTRAQVMAGGSVNKKHCAQPGCTQRFDLRNYSAMRQRHSCGRCLQTFCLSHTAYSPHGASGACGVQSRCVCFECYLEFTPEYQALLESRNTLIMHKGKLGMLWSLGQKVKATAAGGAVAGRGSVGGAGPPPGASAVDGGSAGGGGGFDSSSSSRSSAGRGLHYGPGSSSAQSTGGEFIHGTGLTAQPTEGGVESAGGELRGEAAVEGEQTLGDFGQGTIAQEVQYRSCGSEGDLPPGLLGGMGPGGCGLPRSGSSGQGRLLWARAWTKLRAINMFKVAGHEAHERELRGPA